MATIQGRWNDSSTGARVDISRKEGDEYCLSSPDGHDTVFFTWQIQKEISPGVFSGKAVFIESFINIPKSDGYELIHKPKEYILFFKNGTRVAYFSFCS